MKQCWVLEITLSFGRTMYFVDLDGDFTFVEDANKARHFSSKVEAEEHQEYMVDMYPNKPGLTRMEAVPHGFN